MIFLLLFYSAITVQAGFNKIPRCPPAGMTEGLTFLKTTLKGLSIKL